MSVKMIVSGTSELAHDLEATVKSYPVKVRKFLRTEGANLKAITKEQFRKNGLVRRTGNYLRGVTAQKPYKYYKENGGKAPDSVKVYGKHGKGKANHTHLIEYGHKKVLWGRRTEEHVRGFYVYEDAMKAYDSVFETAAEEFVNDLVKELD